MRLSSTLFVIELLLQSIHLHENLLSTQVMVVTETNIMCAAEIFHTDCFFCQFLSHAAYSHLIA